MNDQQRELEAILRERGLGWAVDLFAPKSAAAQHFVDCLERLNLFATERGREAPEFSSAFLRQFIAASPYKADAFLQALVSIRSTPILFAAWRVLQGMEIDRVELQHVRLKLFSLRIILRSPYDEVEEYQSDDINDIAFVRHLGKSTIDNRPLFDGFYALRQT
jgi:hypothetical protein